MSDLTDEAAHWGVEPDYYDVFGRRYSAGPATLARLTAALSQGHAQPRPVEAPHALLRAYQGDGRRSWGLAVQLYALRSRRNWGIGDFTDLRALLALAARRGAGAIALNPLHALFMDRAEDASPYAPNSRLFLNPLYINVEAIPEFTQAAAAEFAAEAKALRSTELVAYAKVADIKSRALRIVHQSFRKNASAARRRDFESYRKEQGDALLRFACFEVLRQRFAPAPWAQWPQSWRRPDGAQLADFRSEHDDACEFQEFVQWTADRQLAACADAARGHGMPIGLYTDLAIGIDHGGADAWSRQDAVLGDVSVGAPPDEFNPAGQNWDLAPFNPHTLADDDFAVQRELMRAVMRHAGALRLDHVLGLKRLFMIPRGQQASEGAYVRFPFEPLLRAIAEESERNRCIVVGEDLGTVPEGFRETIMRWGLWCCRVLLFERDHDGGFRAPHAYPAEAVASFNTHDLPSYQGWLTAHDLHVKRGLGLDPGENDDQRAQSQHRLRTALAEHASHHAADDAAAMAAFLGATPSRLAVIALDDVLGMRDQVNIPGTTTEHPNWRRKLPATIEELADDEGLRRVADAFAQAGRAISR